MLIRFMAAYENEGVLNPLPTVFDTFEDAEHSANEHEARNPAFVFMVCRVVPAIRDESKNVLKELLERAEGSLLGASHDLKRAGKIAAAVYYTEEAEKIRDTLRGYTVAPL